MTRKKWGFHKLRRECPQWWGSEPDPKPLPADVNDSMEQIAQRFNDSALDLGMQEARTKKLYGKLTHRNKTGAVVAEFEFQHGICTRAVFHSHYGVQTSFARSVHNDEIDMTKEKKQG